MEKLVLSYSDIFSPSKSDLGKCNLGVKHHIHLKPEAVPSKLHAEFPSDIKKKSRII